MTPLRRLNRLIWGALLLVVAVIWVGRTTWHEGPEHEAVAAVSQPRIELLATHSTWQGHPVFALINRSGQPMDHVNVYSWSEALLPVLWVGSRLPADEENRSTLPPPFALKSGDTMWIVGANSTTGRFSVTWRWNGGSYYANLTVEPSR